MQTIAELWEEFRSMCIPNAGEIQRIEMEKAFYAGFAGCFSAVMEISEKHPAKAMKGMEKLDKEIMAWEPKIPKNLPPGTKIGNS